MKNEPLVCVLAFVALSACAAHSRPPATEKPTATASGIGHPDNAPAITAFVGDVKRCWEAKPEDLTEAGCPPITNIRDLYVGADDAARPKVFDTLVRWFGEPSDWRYRKVAASVLVVRSDGNSETLGRVLAVMRNEVQVQTPMRAADNLRSNMAQYVGNLAARVTGENAAILAYTKDKANSDQDARAIFISDLGASQRPGHFEALLVVARDTTERDEVRRAALEAVSGYDAAEQKPKISALLFELARKDPSKAVAEKALFVYKGYGVPNEARTVVSIITERQDAEVSSSGMVMLQVNIAPKASAADKKVITTFCIQTANDGTADARTRAVAVATLRDLQAPQWKKLATQLARSSDAELAAAMKELLANKK